MLYMLQWNPIDLFIKSDTPLLNKSVSFLLSLDFGKRYKGVERIPFRKYCFYKRLT